MKTGRKVRGVFWRDGQWWIRWVCTLGHDHRKPSGDLKTAATEEHKAKRAEVDALPASLRPFMTMALHTGMRRGELRALRWEDVDFATGALRVRRDKAGDGRWVVLNRVALEALRTLKREQRVSGPYVFCSPEGRFLHNFERVWRPALRAAAIPDFRFHDSRHTFASRLAMAGADLYTVQRAGGWKSQAMVQRYAHLSPDHIRAGVEKLALGVPGSGTGTKTGTAQ
jgi:integrase